VLVHGFTATPDEVRPLGDALAAAGFPCAAVRLPGHATVVGDLARVRASDWIDTVERAVAAMAARTPRVAVAGVSLGALLGLAVAAAGREPVQALVCCATPLRFADERAGRLSWIAWVPRAVWRRRLVRKRGRRDILDPEARARSTAYDAMPLGAVMELLRLRTLVLASLGRVTQPTLVLHGRQDHTAPVDNAEELRRRLVHARVEVEIFERSAHVLTEDAERDAVAARAVRFLDAIAATRPG
jgi:carboxylesterase